MRQETLLAIFAGAGEVVVGKLPVLCADCTGDGGGEPACAVVVGMAAFVGGSEDGFGTPFFRGRDAGGESVAEVEMQLLVGGRGGRELHGDAEIAECCEGFLLTQCAVLLARAVLLPEVRVCGSAVGEEDDFCVAAEFMEQGACRAFVVVVR